MTEKVGFERIQIFVGRFARVLHVRLFI
jgi:hypothetical protein